MPPFGGSALGAEEGEREAGGKGRWGDSSPKQHRPLSTTFWMLLLTLCLCVTGTFPALPARSLSALQIKLSLASINNNKQYQLRSLL